MRRGNGVRASGALSTTRLEGSKAKTKTKPLKGLLHAIFSLVG